MPHQTRVIPYELELERPFRVSWTSRVQSPSILLQIDEGWGEAAPSKLFGESPGQTIANLERTVRELPENLDALEDVIDSLREPLARNRSALAAVDIALHDRWAKRLGAPLWRLFGLDPQKAPTSSFTIGIDTTEAMIEQALYAPSPILKIKTGRDIEHDLAVLREVRRRTDKTIRVDANEGWSREETRRAVAVLADLGVELLEQPLEAGDLEGYRELVGWSQVPIFLDENCHTSRDVPSLAGLCHGVNVKLMKSGGLLEARRIVAVARALGLKLMLGCMIETSVAITAAAHIAPLFDYIDLDGNVLTTNDPFEGARWANGRLVAPAHPGLGVHPTRLA